MRILLLNQFFWPDVSPTSQLLTDVAREFASEGHDVFSICADGSYAKASADDHLDVTIYRVKALPFSRGVIGRVLSYASFYAKALWRSFRMPKPDLVITLTTPPLLSLLGNALSSLRGSRHFIWEMDIYPDVAVDLGQFAKDGIADRLTGFLADWSRRRADGIIALGECMKERLVARHISSGLIFVAQNWADSETITPLPFHSLHGSLSLLYSGNLGLAHDIETIIGAVRQLKDHVQFEFSFVGGGAHHATLRKLAADEGLDAVRVAPYVPREELGASLARADIGLVTQRDCCCGSVVPSKVYALLAAARPILFIGPANATPARLIREFGCGWHVSCGEVAQLVDLLHYLATHKGEVIEAGARAREALMNHFDLPLGVKRIVEITGTQALSAGAQPRLGQAISQSQSSV